MGFETALRLTATHYGNYPGPTETTYRLAEGVAGFFKENGVTSMGVIAVAIGSDDYHYLGLSPQLQREVMTNMAEGQGLAHGHFRLGRGLEAKLGVKFDLCRKVNDDIVGKVKFNFGCAEKKILSNLNLRELTMEEISVIGYPDVSFAAKLEANIVVVSADGAYIAPCKSCLALYQ